MKKGAVGAVFLGVVMVVGLIIIAMCTKKVPAGYVGWFITSQRVYLGKL